LPFGKYPDFDACVSDQMKEHDEEEAKRICGALQQQLEGSLLVSGGGQQQESKAVSYEDNGRLFLKIFLLDGSVNLNDWGVAPSSISHNITTAIGKPVVVYKNAKGQYDHPPLAGQDSLDHALAYQDLFRIGTYIDVFESQTKPGQWWGIAEVTDEDFKRGVREDPTIPFYVSPTIRLLHPNQSDQSLTDWAFMHSAVVSEPAYTAKKAYISGQCSGNHQTCLLQLRKASINRNHNEGKPGCGFCKYEAVKEIQKNIVDSFSSQLPNRQQLQSRHKVMANSNNENRNSSVSENVNQPEPTNNNNNNVTQQVEQKEQQKETTKVVKQVGNGGNGNGDNGNNNKDTNEEEERNNQEGEKQQKQASAKELLEAVQRLSTEKKAIELKLQQAVADNETYKNLNTQFNDRLAALEKERDEERFTARKAAITNRLERSPLYQNMPADERQRQIENYVNGTTTLEQLEGQLVPLEASFKKASMGFVSASYRPSLRLGGSNSNSKEVDTRSASTTTSKSNNELPANLRLHNQFYGSDGGVQ
jgi:hypothetical protein